MISKPRIFKKAFELSSLVHFVRAPLCFAIGAVSLSMFFISTARADKPTTSLPSTSAPATAPTTVNSPTTIPTPATASSSGPANASKGVSAYDQLVFDAHKAFVAGSAGGSIEGAIDGYRKAIALEPQRPEAHHFLAGALFYKQDFAAAQEAISNAVSRARGDAAQANLLGKSLFLTAVVKEALGKGEEAKAKAAWVAYGEFAKVHPDQEMPKEKLVGDAPPVLMKVYPATVVERVNRIEAYAKLTADYAKVKERVLARQKELGIATPAEPAKKPNP